MPTELKCVGCGAVYPLAAVQHRDKFACTQCARPILVPIAGPSSARARGAGPPVARASPRGAPEPSEPPPIPVGEVVEAAPIPVPRRAPAPAPVSRPVAARVPREAASPWEMKPLRTASIVVLVLFGVYVLLDLVSITQDFALIDFVQAVQRGETADVARAEEIDASGSTLGIAILVTGVGLAAAFCTWLHRAHSNLRRARLTHLKYGSGWAIGGFFVPILNLARPYQVMCEVWRGTSWLAGLARVSTWQRARVSPLVGWWWGLLLASTAAARLTVKISLRFQSLESLIYGARVSIAASVLGIAAALAAARIVHTLSRLQDEAAAQADGEGSSS